MNIEYQKKQYDEKLRIIEGKFYVMAKIWFAKGRKNLYLPSFTTQNELFDKLWKKFYSISLRCPECGNIITLKLDVDKTFVINEMMDEFISLICRPCGQFIDIDKWEVIENGS